ncbi:hypothetical protein [Candidatus Vidania fulgoroideorum]
MNFCLLGLGNIGKHLLNCKIDFFKEIYIKNFKKKDIFFLRKKKIRYVLKKKFDSKKNVVETVGGKNIFFLLKNIKKIIITANKNIVSIFFYKIKKLLFEASVGGGIQIIKNLFYFNFIKYSKLEAILNGTTNFLLSKMEENFSYKQSLKIALKKGFAEKNSFYDLSGLDIAYKLDILNKILFKFELNPNSIYIEKIEFSSPNYFKGYSIKYLAKVKRIKNIFELMISTFLVKKNILLHSNLEKNVISIKYNKFGNLSFYGKGAGFSTCFSLISDLKFLKFNNLVLKTKKKTRIFYINIIFKKVFFFLNQNFGKYIYIFKKKYINKGFLVYNMNNKRIIRIKNYLKNKIINFILYRIL